eukprot:2582087-Pleurochrysis_carterae.AAC.1
MKASIGLCPKFIDSQQCSNKVAYTSPHFLEQCIKRRLTVCRHKPEDVTGQVAIWRDMLGNDVRRKLEKQKQAAANLTFKVSDAYADAANEWRQAHLHAEAASWATRRRAEPPQLRAALRRYGCNGE